MPLFGRKKFTPLEISADIKPETEVFYLPTTNEVFVDYDAYFERIVHLNSSVWTCAITAKPGLTFDEARESEENALKQIEEFPAALERAILYAVRHLSARRRLEDLVNDVCVFIKDRYFVNEELNYKNRKHRVRVVRVRYVGDDEAAAKALSSLSNERRASTAAAKQAKDNAMDNDDAAGGGENGVDDTKTKIALPEMPAADRYRYTIQIVDENDDGAAQNNGGVHADVKFTEISRDRFGATKSLVKLIVKYYTEFSGHKLDVKDRYVCDFMLDELEWSSIADGPLPVFPQTAKPSATQPTVKKETKKPSNLAASSAASTTSAAKKAASVSSSAAATAASAAAASADTPAKSANAVSSPTKSQSKAAKRQQKILDQQKELAPLLKSAEELGVENIDRWRQTVLLLVDDDIHQLKEEIRDRERKRLVEKRKREREELAERKKPRDDLQCDDLKPLPKYHEFLLADWVPRDIYVDLIAAHNFFYCFAALLTSSGKTPFTLGAIAAAVMKRGTDNATLVDIFRTLLRARNECADEEDGDEANVDNSQEIGYIPFCDLDHQIYGNMVRERSRRHEDVRETFGVSVRFLPITPGTITELIRLVFETSGYYIKGNVKMQQATRGGIKCYEDAAFQFSIEHPEIMEKLRTASIFVLSARERLAIMHVLMQQLLSYASFRAKIDERINHFAELKRDLRTLREFDRVQERDSREAQIIKEAEAKISKSNEEKKKPSKVLQTLRNYLKFLNEGGGNTRSFNELSAKQTLLEPMPFDEMDAREVSELRELQREVCRQKQAELLRDIFICQSEMGPSFLGRDRAFHTYYFFHNLNLFIVDRPMRKDIEDSCDMATPLLGFDVDDKSSQSTDTTTNDADGETADMERIARTACTGKPANCPVHSSAVCSTPDAPRWMYFVEREGVDHLIEALNPRGFREMELAENIHFLKEIYDEKMNEQAERMEKSIDSTQFLRKALELSADLNADEMVEDDEETTKAELQEEFRRTLLDMEEKLFTRNIGAVACVDREEWRRCLEDDGDTTHLCANNRLETYNGDGTLLNIEQLERLGSVEKLAVAFLQIVKGIDIESIMDPFVDEHKKKKVLAQTSIFAAWQNELLKCENVSRLALFFATFDKALNWKKVTKCGSCAKKIESNNKQVVRCNCCQKTFHFGCSKISKKRLKSKRFLSAWNCMQCAEEDESSDVDEEDAEEEEEEDELENGHPVSDEDEENDNEVTDEDGEKEDESVMVATTSNGRANGRRLLNNADVDDEQDEEADENEEIGSEDNDDDSVVPRTTSSMRRSTAMANGRQAGNGQLNGSASVYDALANGIGGRKRRAASRRFIDYVYASEASATDESGAESPTTAFGHAKIRKCVTSTAPERSLRNRKSILSNNTSSGSESFNYRHLSMGLRESDDQRRAKLKSCEALVRDAMGKPFGEAFAFPVDSKFVPHYYDVIKHPMDLRTMINKLKSFQYDSPEDLWADCRLMFENCAQFNDEGTPIRADAIELKQFMKTRFEAILGHGID